MKKEKGDNEEKQQSHQKEQVIMIMISVHGFVQEIKISFIWGVAYQGKEKAQQR